MIVDDVELDVEDLAEASFGLFDAHEFQVVGEIESPTLEFRLGDEQHRFTDDVATFPMRWFDFVASRMGRHCQLVRPHAILHPSPSPTYHVIFCRPKALKRLEGSGLIPLAWDELESSSFMERDTEMGWKAG